ncbi:hypothetical protein HKD37_02G005111 [Glycine soja]
MKNQASINVLEAKIISSSNIGEKIFIPRLTSIPFNPRIPFQFRHKQFLVVVSFAMTVNKRLFLKHVGIYLARPVFSHRQLCVLMSRVTTHEGLKIFICSEDGNNSNITLNVVYRKVFQNFNKVMILHIISYHIFLI